MDSLNICAVIKTGIIDGLQLTFQFFMSLKIKEYVGLSNLFVFESLQTTFEYGIHHETGFSSCRRNMRKIKKF